MATQPLVLFAGSWPDDEKQLLRHTITEVEPLASAATAVEHALGPPWVINRQAFSSFTFYMAHRLGASEVLTARSASKLADAIRRLDTPASPSLFQLIYESAASRPMAADDLKRLLEQARDKNQRLGITGLLLYKSNRFMQVLEGQEETVRTLYATIRADERHHDVTTLLTTAIFTRTFPAWSMSLENLDAYPWKGADGVSRYLQDEHLNLSARPVSPLLSALERFRAGATPA